MAEIDPVILKLIADTKSYQAEIRDVTKRVQDQLGRQEKSVQQLERQFTAASSNISASMKRMAAGIAGALSVRELMNYADSFTRVQNSLKVAGLEGHNLAQVQGQLLDLSGKYGVSLEELSRLFGNSTQAASDLGASQDQLVQLTEASAQALKITGTSAVQASGAILGLTQALASCVVRAEEFNQINEGGLRPLLQVVANTEKYGGSIAKLRAAVADGKVSSQEFFQAIMNGSSTLEGQASKATITLAGSFEALNSKLTVYFGEADKANGASAAMAAAISKLADNLDTVVPAIEAIAAAIGVRYVAGAVAATSATTVLRGALVSLQTVGIAAVVAGIGYFITQFIEARNRLNDLADDVYDAENALKIAKDRAQEAGVKIADLGDKSLDASNGINIVGNALSFASKQAESFYKNAKLAAISAAQLRIANAEVEADRLKPVVNNGQTIVDRAKRFGNQLPDTFVQDLKLSKAALESQNATILAAKEELKWLVATPEAAFNKPVSSTASTGETDSEKKKRLAAEKRAAAAAAKAAREAERDAREALQRRQESRADEIEILQAHADLTTNIDERADLEREMLALERQARQDDLDSRKDLSDKERKARQDTIDTLYGKAHSPSQNGDIVVEGNQGLLNRKLTMEAVDKANQEALSIAQADLDNQHDLLSAQADLASTREERRSLELRLLDLQYQQEENELNATKESETASKAAKEIARQRLAILGQLKARDTESTNRQYEGPLASYRREISDTASSMNDQYESIAVSGLQSLNDGLTDAIMNAKSFGDVFGNVAKQVIADLIRIAIQQTIVKNLMSVLGGGSGNSLSGALTTASGNVSALASGIKIPGFASGTNYAPGGIALVGENGPELVNLPTGSKVVPNTKLAAAVGGGTTMVTQVLKFDLSNAVMTPQLLAQMNQMAQQAAVGGAVAGANMAQTNIASKSRRRIPGR